MLRISKLTDYAILMMVELAREGEMLSAHALRPASGAAPQGNSQGARGGTHDPLRSSRIRPACVAIPPSTQPNTRRHRALPGRVRPGLSGS